MKNFDEEYTLSTVVDGREVPITVHRNKRAERPADERSFVIGGETFVYRTAVVPEAFKSWSAMTGGEFVERDERGKALRDQAGNVISTLTEDEALKIMDETVLAFLEPGSEEKWEAVRSADAASPLTLEDIRALVRWLFEEQTARPTGRPSGSSNGSGAAATGTSSTAASRSPAETA